MKYYIYISDSKVDMFHAQIPKKRLKKIAGELKIDTGLISASVSGELSLDSRISRLEIVKKYLEEENNIGSTEYPGEYFKDVEPLRWGYYGGRRVPKSDHNFNSPLVYFGGKVGETTLGLGGSSKHVIGDVGESWPHSHSGTPFIISQLINQLNDRDKKAITKWKENTSTYFNDFDAGAIRAVELASENMDGPIHEMEFLAKRLIQSPIDEDKEVLSPKVILGTPLYVAINN